MLNSYHGDDNASITDDEIEGENDPQAPIEAVNGAIQAIKNILLGGGGTAIIFDKETDQNYTFCRNMDTADSIDSIMMNFVNLRKNLRQNGAENVAKMITNRIVAWAGGLLKT